MDRLGKTFYLLDTFAGVDEKIHRRVRTARMKFSATGEILKLVFMFEVWKESFVTSHNGATCELFRDAFPTPFR